MRAAAPPAQPAPLAQIGKPDAAEAARILEQFRQSGIAGHYFLEFELQQMPRRGETKVFTGRLWGSRNSLGAVERINVTGADGVERRLLVQHGLTPMAWRLKEGRAEPLPAAALFEALVPGVELAAFDLLMPYLSWPDPTVERILRVRGRPAHEFLFRPPPDFAPTGVSLSAVRACFDTQYDAPVQTEWFAADGSVTKTLTLVDLKKVSGQWIVKSLEVRDEARRDKTRLVVTGAAMNLMLPESMFTPAALDRAIAAPPSEQVIPLGR
ncbi:MAG: outer membrane lipoprotein-sorting protein [Verrucomicrobia bacterium]|nr:outer membrane lipoprotein-sorting protein [Verrucomicrobiota bacterium]